MLSAGKFDLPLSRKNTTTIQVVPDAVLGISAVNIKGRWRFNTATVERVVTGAKGTYGIWAVAEDNSINNTPNPFTDHTVYTFELRVSATEPAVGAGTAIATKVGEVDWSGTEIETIRQIRGIVTGAQIETGALEAGTEIEWKRAPGGGFIPVSKKESIAEEKLNAALLERLQSTGRGAHFFSGAELTRTNTAIGSFSTPIKLELPVVKANQQVEISMLVFVLGAATAPFIGLRYGGLAIGPAGSGIAGATPFALADKQVGTEAKFFGYGTGVTTEIALLGTAGIETGQIASAIALMEEQAWPITAVTAQRPLILKAKNAEQKNVVIEVVGKVASGTAVIHGAWLAAHVRD